MLRIPEGKPRHIKFLRIYLSKNLFKLGSTKPETVRSAPPTGAKRKIYRDDTETKQEN